MAVSPEAERALAIALSEAADVDVERFLPLLAEARSCLEDLGDSRGSLRALEERCLPSDEDEEPDVELPPVEADPPP